MNPTKIVVASCFCSLSALAFWNAFRGLSEPGSASKNDSQQDNGTEANRANQTKQAAKPAIATPETLKNSNAAKRAPASPDQQAQASQLVEDAPAKPPRLPAWLESSRRSLPSYNVAPPETVLASSNSRDVDVTVSPKASMQDIQGHWAEYSISTLVEKRIVQGYPDGQFRPNQAITKAEFNTMIQKALGSSGSAIAARQLQASLSSHPTTRAEAAVIIYQALMQVEPAPIVTSIQVNGAVARPGAYSMAARSNEYLKQDEQLPTVRRAIQQAGGSLTNADLKQVEIHRLTDSGQTKVIKVDVLRSPQVGGLSQDVVLQQEDKIVIPASASISQEPLQEDLTKQGDTKSGL